MDASHEPEASAPRPASLPEALSDLQRVRAEHQPIFDQVVTDPGMDPRTRAMLLGHLREEEEERLARIAGLARRSSAPPRGRAGEPLPPLPQSPPRLTVGSLRPLAPGPPPPAGPGSTRGSVGSLRRG